MGNILKIIGFMLTPVGLLMLCGCSKYKEQDGKMYYIYWRDEAHRFEREVEQYDSKNFKVLGRFFSWNVLTGYDRPWAKDKSHVYYRGLLVEGADPQSFKPQSMEWAVDKDHIFYEHNIRSSASPNTLRVSSGNYAVDSDSVYYIGRTISDADPATFKVLSKGYAVDKSNIFHNGELAGEVYDPTKFRVLDFLWGRDGKFYYFNGVKVQGADYDTFEIIPYGKSASMSWAKDKRHVYYGYASGGVKFDVVDGADPATFKVTGRWDDVGVDKNGYYQFGKKVDRSEVEYNLR